MATDHNHIDISISGSFDEISRELSQLEEQADQFGSAITTALKSAVIDGNNFSEVLNSLALSLSTMALKSALSPIESGLSNLFSSALTNNPFFGGASALPANLIPFADGGIVSSPTLFPMGGTGANIGLMGEAGSEAILPLVRGSDGALGVASSSSQGSPVNISFNINTPDAEGFKRSETQISAMLARAVSRGRRGL
ncbi:MAG: phage tail tape measure protein [Rhizobiaceae bacterium]|nr:phage tail tape measure protein [Rhizobiaceae bacterium]